MTVTTLFSLACENIRKNFQEHKNNISSIFLEIIYDDFYQKYPLNKKLTKYIPIMKDFVLNKESQITIKENNRKLRFYLHTWFNDVGFLSKSIKDKNGKYKYTEIKVPTLWRWEFTVKTKKQLRSANHRAERRRQFAQNAVEREERKEKQEQRCRQEQKKNYEKISCENCNVLAHEAELYVRIFGAVVGPYCAPCLDIVIIYQGVYQGLPLSALKFEYIGSPHDCLLNVGEFSS